MLSDILKEKRCFKLVCGAGNEDEAEVEKLVTLYSLAGANFFDICSKPEILEAAKRGIERAGIRNERYICCSVGVKNDPHFRKACINKEKCSKCKRCISVCLEHAIKEERTKCDINQTKCIGCGKCVSVCEKQAIDLKSEYKNLKEILPPLIKQGADCIEFHTLNANEDETDEKWKEINDLFDGIPSICINRSILGDKGVLSRVERMIKARKPYTTIIQADGAPMSGGKDDYKTTLQTVATAEIFQNANLPVYILLSGGTNSKTTELAKLCGIKAHGVAIGSFARNLVREYTEKDDFLENKVIFNKALERAKALVSVSLENLG